MAVILVGAMIVAGIDTGLGPEKSVQYRGKREIQITDYSNQVPAVQLPLGGELGRFRLGSTAIVLFQHGTMKI